MRIRLDWSDLGRASLSHLSDEIEIFLDHWLLGLVHWQTESSVVRLRKGFPLNLVASRTLVTLVKGFCSIEK